jgi:hypothetical protein
MTVSLFGLIKFTSHSRSLMLHLWIYLQPLESTHWVELSKWQSRIQDSFSRAYCSHGRPVSAIPYPTLKSAKFLSLSATEIYNHSYPQYGTPQISPHLRLTVYNSATSVSSTPILAKTKKINVHVWLPFTHWYGRFRSIGGGGFATGLFDPILAVAVSQGYSAAATDGGHSAAPEKGIWASD